MSDFNDPTAIATSEQYRAALLAVRERMTDIQLKMLQAHCRSDGHATCTNHLAEILGMSTPSSAKTVYSNYARWIADELKYAPTPGAKKQMWLHSLAYVRPDGNATAEGQYEWIMRPELVATLQSMRWA